MFTRACVVGLLCLWGCTKAPDPRVLPDPKAEREAELAQDERLGPPPKGTKRAEIAPGEPPTIEVIEEGSDPQPLRLRPNAGDHESLTMTMRMSTKMGEGTPVMVSPPIVTRIDCLVDVVDTKWIEATIRFVSMTVEAETDAPPEMTATMREMLSGFESFQARLQVDDRGALNGGIVDVPQGLPAPMQEMVSRIHENFAQLQVPLPEEPVGVGGRWRATSRLEQGGIKLKQVSDFQLLARDGSNLEVSVSLEQTVVDAKFSPPNMPEVKGTIESYSGKGRGTLTLDLTSLNPARSNTTIDIASEVTIDFMGQVQEQATQVSVALQMERSDTLHSP